MAIAASYAYVSVGFKVDLRGLIGGRVSASRWDYGDGLVVTNQPYTSHAWAAPGDYVVELRAYNATYPAGVAATVTVRVSATQPVHYVALGSLSPAPPYSSWATAATNIQDAVDAAAPGGLVLVSNGVYDAGARSVDGMSNRVAVSMPLIVRSLNGPAVTSVVGYQVPGTTNGAAAVRCAYLTDGAMLDGFTLTNGATQTSGNNVSSRSGGGVWCQSPGAFLSNCVLTGNSASYHGGGAYSGTLGNCVLTNNSASIGGGAESSTLRNCALTGNSAQIGGGASSSTLNNCILTGNSASSGGGACYSTLNNCSVTGNSGSAIGGGASSSTNNNCIICYNMAPTDANYYVATLNYCCTTPLPVNGSGNRTDDPQLASPSHLSPGSPCRGAGSPAYATGLDLDGEPWANPPSIGCDEFWSGTVTGAVSVAMAASYTNVAVGFEVNLEAFIGGRVNASRWDYGDGVMVSNRPYASHGWAAPGDYVVELRAYNETYPAGVAATVTVQVAAQPVHYVALGSPSPTPPYNSWATAATNIQDAVDAAMLPGALVLVSNGVYEAGARAVYGMSNRVAVTKPVAVRSLNGPGLTIIKGYRVPGTTNGAAAVRCAYLTNGAVLAGFTLTNGATQSSGDYCSQQSGGGVWAESISAVVSDCVLTGNSASRAGGGACSATLNNCTVTANSAPAGGGASYGMLINCALIGNSALGADGGGAYGGTLNNCTLTGNSALYGYGGGAYVATLNNCTLTGNSAGFGGGAAISALNNCIVYYNTAGSGPNCILRAGDTLNHCCTAPLSAGAGNFAAEPAFVNLAGGDLRLQSNSPCINSGGNAYALGLTDLDGNPRIVGGIVDVGAYEHQTPTSNLPYIWLLHYGLALDGTPDLADPDHDGLNNRQEWLTGTDPTNSNSALRILSATNALSGIAVTWASVTNRSYWLERATDLSLTPAFSMVWSNIPGLVGVTSFIDTNASGAGPFFYRVRTTTP